MSFECCRNCAPPKRNPWCHCKGNCTEYEEEKAAHDARKAEADRKRDVQGGLTAQVLRGVNKAYKARKKMKGK